jgi:D-amino-acid dehydrogenase
MQPGKGYSITIRRPDPCPTTPLVLAEPSMAVTPWPSGLRLGGTMEFSGYDSTLRRKRLDALYRGGRRFLRGDLNREVFERWCGWRPMTPTELPIIDRVPRLENLIVATGHGMMGVSMAPATALLVRALVTGEDCGIDPAPYRIDPQWSIR